MGQLLCHDFGVLQSGLLADYWLDGILFKLGWPCYGSFYVYPCHFSEEISLLGGSIGLWYLQHSSSPCLYCLGSVFSTIWTKASPSNRRPFYLSFSLDPSILNSWIPGSKPPEKSKEKLISINNSHNFLNRHNSLPLRNIRKFRYFLPNTALINRQSVVKNPSILSQYFLKGQWPVIVLQIIYIIHTVTAYPTYLIVSMYKDILQKDKILLDYGQRPQKINPTQRYNLHSHWCSDKCAGL